jgi:hypothetical protein
MAGAGDVILVMGVVAVPAGLLIAYGTNFNGFKDWFDSLFAKGTGSFLPAYGPATEADFPSDYTTKGGISKTSAKQLSDAGLNSAGRPKSAGHSGNCTWDTKGGFCWNSTACGKAFKVCATYPAYTSVNYCCSAIRDKFISNAPKCAGTTTPKPAPKPAPKPVATCPGKSGNCTWDCKNAYCWTSTGPRANKICIHGGTNRSQWCSQARSEFIAYNAGTPTKAFRTRSLSLSARAFAGRRIPIRMSTSYR